MPIFTRCSSILESIAEVALGEAIDREAETARDPERAVESDKLIGPRGFPFPISLLRGEEELLESEYPDPLSFLLGTLGEVEDRTSSIGYEEAVEER